MELDRSHEELEAAGIASEVASAQVISQQTTCVEGPPPCLHTVCTDEALLEIVAAWHGLAPEVREKIINLVRSSRLVR
jgi:hypothetical protein